MVTGARGGVDFDEFFRVEYPKLVAVATALVGSHEIACELAQEALLRSHRSWARVVSLDVPGAWVRRVLINLATDHHRASTRARRHAARSVADDESADEPRDPVVAGFWDAVRALPDRQRAVVVLRYIEDRSVAEVAAVLGIAEGTVKATLAKARTTLARTIPREG